MTTTSSAVDEAAVLDDRAYATQWRLFHGLDADERYTIVGLPAGVDPETEITLGLETGAGRGVVTSTTLAELLAAWSACQLSEPVRVAVESAGLLVARCAGTHGAYWDQPR